MSNIDHIRTIFKRLLFLGYQWFQIRQIIEEAIGQSAWEKNNQRQNVQIIINLEKYEKLGNEYMLTYNK